MKRARVLGLLALFVFALTAATASAAEGPFYKIAGNRLNEGAEPISATVTKEYVLVTSKAELKCTAQKLESSSLSGSPGKNAGGSVEYIVFEGCSVAKNGSPCEPVSERIAGVQEAKVVRTRAVINKLEYEKETREGKILIHFKPALGNVFANLKFPAATCTIKEAQVEGTVGAEAWSGGKAIEVGKEPKLAKAGEVNFPAALIAVGFIEEKGNLAKTELGLKAFGVATSSFAGRSEVTLNSGKEWCISTAAAGSEC